MPVPAQQAKGLCLVGRPARFGKGEQTLLDAKVRDTWEIPKDRIKIDKRQWDAILDGLRADLGLPQGCQLGAVPLDAALDVTARLEDRLARYGSGRR